MALVANLPTNDMAYREDCPWATPQLIGGLRFSPLASFLKSHCPEGVGCAAGKRTGTAFASSRKGDFARETFGAAAQVHVASRGSYHDLHQMAAKALARWWIDRRTSPSSGAQHVHLPRATIRREPDLRGRMEHHASPHRSPTRARPPLWLIGPSICVRILTSRE